MKWNRLTSQKMIMENVLNNNFAGILLQSKTQIYQWILHCSTQSLLSLEGSNRYYFFIFNGSDDWNLLVCQKYCETEHFLEIKCFYTLPKCILFVSHTLQIFQSKYLRFPKSQIFIIPDKLFYPFIQCDQDTGIYCLENVHHNY